MAGSSVGVVIITHRSRDLLEGCLRPLVRSHLAPRILVVNSSSNDGTVERARELGAETWVIPRPSFNHGRTREEARQRLGTDIVVMLTPDAHATDDDFLERLVAPIVHGEASISYGRQLPRAEADPLERFNRLFNYPEESQIRSLEDWPRFGSYTHFCSDSCCAWSQAALDEIGGLPTTLVSEETIAAARLLARGHRMAYVAEAAVIHSHGSGLWVDFQRQFDIGYTRRLFADDLLVREADEARGMRYLKAMLGHIRRERPALLPYALLHTAARYAGYRTGMLATRLPRGLATRLSSQDFFWGSEHGRRLVGGRTAAA